MRSKLFIACSGLIVLASATAVAQQAFVPAQSGIRRVERWRPANTKGDTRIIGTVIDISQTPVAFARLQLRDLAKGVVQQEATSDGNGEYSFEVVDPGTYVVEMVTVEGYTVALSNAGSLGRFETMQTVVQLPGRWDLSRLQVVMDQRVTNYFGMSAQTTMTAATLVLAVDQNITPADANEPVSPH
jgi:hypothetical protein